VCRVDGAWLRGLESLEVLHIENRDGRGTRHLYNNRRSFGRLKYLDSTILNRSDSRDLCPVKKLGKLRGFGHG
jgi:hypothetical protein